MKNIPDKHVFVCTNCRKSSKKSCGDEGLIIRSKLVEILKTSNTDKNIRINKSGCLNLCEDGPVMVIYPEKIWYKNVSLEDCQEIFNKSIFENNVVERLSIINKNNNR